MLINDISGVHFIVPRVAATLSFSPATRSHLSVLHLVSVDVGAGATACAGEGVGARAGEGILRFRKRWEAKNGRGIHEPIFL